MPAIHPTSTVSCDARIADDVVIGPGCILEGAMTLAAGNKLIANVHLQGPLTVGTDNVFYPHCCIGFAPQDLSYDWAHHGAGLHIGNGNVFREGVTLHRATGASPTRIGHDNYLMVGAHVGHDAVIADGCTLANCVLVAGYAELEDGAVLGGGAGVHQFCRIGRLAMVSGHAVVMQDMPPFCTCYLARGIGSLNLVGLRRSGNRRHIRPLKQAFDILLRQGHTNSKAVMLIETQLAEDELCMELARFVGRTKRGITPYKKHDR